MNNAKWIWTKEKYEVNEYADFIKEFEILEIDNNATIKISADSEYILWINGEFVSAGQFSDFPENKIYDEIKIGGFLKSGKNKIAVTAYFQGTGSLRYKPGIRGLKFAVYNGDDVILSDKTTWSRLSKTYKNGEIHLTTKQMGYGFEYDATKDDGFYNESYKADGGWEESAEVELLSTAVLPRPVKKLVISKPVKATIVAQGNLIRKDKGLLASELMESDFLSHKKFAEFFEGEKTFPVSLIEKRQDSDGIYFIVDLGKESAGYLNFELETNEGTRIDIAHGEHLRDMRVRTKIWYRNFADTYICKEGRQNFTHYGRRIACRYIGVHITNFKNLKLNYVGLKHLDYPFENEATFKCSDTLHNKIFEVCMRTLKLCMHEHYEDCPWREQALYGSDSRNASVCAHYTLGGSFQFTRASLDLLRQSVLDETYVNLCAPADRLRTIPSFTMLWLLANKEYADFSGDTTLITENWAQFKKMIEIFSASSSDGILKPVRLDNVDTWNYYEWSDDQPWLEALLKEKGESIYDGLYHIFVYMAINSAIWMADKAGDSEFIKKYTAFAEGMKKVFNEKFWDEEKQLYTSHIMNGKAIRFDELTQAMAVFTGICGKDREDRLLDVLADKNNGLLKLSLSYLIYKYEVLLSKGMKYADFVFEEIAEKWGAMLFEGSTTFWENEGGNESDTAGSMCHAWSATPIIVYFKYVLGTEFKDGEISVNENAPCRKYFSKVEAKLPVLK